MLTDELDPTILEKLIRERHTIYELPVHEGQKAGCTFPALLITGKDKSSFRAFFAEEPVAIGNMKISELEFGAAANYPRVSISADMAG